MKNNRLILLVLIILIICTICVGCNNKNKNQNNDNAVIHNDSIVYDQSIAEEKYLKERISDATAIYYKSSVNGEFGDDRYLFEETILPKSYTELNYIQSTGSQYIDTGIQYADTLTFDLKFSDYINSPNTGGIFGTEGWMFSLSHYTNARLYWCADGKTSFSYNSFSPYKTYTVQCGKDFLTVNDINTISKSDTNIFGTKNITIFKTNMGYSSLKLYYFKIYDGETIVRNYIPCYRNYDNAVGLYDLISKRFYCNSTEYNFKYEEKEKEASAQLPSAYQQVEYIEATGTQFIDTGFVPNKNSGIEITFSAQSYENDGAYIYGAGVRSGDTAFELYPWNNTLEFNYGDECLFAGAVPPANTKITAYHKKTNVGFSFDGYTYSGTISNQEFTTPYSLTICALHRETILPSQSMRVYDCVIYDGNVIVRNYMPCYRISDKKPGLYDLIDNKFYGNSGEGEFLHGNPIYSKDDVNLPSAYQQVEYIEATGTQYIDIPDVNWDYWEIDCQYTATSNQMCIVGNQDGGSANRWELFCDSDRPYFLIWANEGDTTTTSTVSATTRAVTTYTKSTGDVIINGVQFATKTINVRPAYLFRYGSNSYYATAKIYRYRMKYNGVLTLDLIPCVRKSDNKPGLYDLITNTFLTNSGTGEFVYGNPIYGEDDTVLPTDYLQLEYIESDGTQIIDTGFVPKYSTGFDMYVEYGISSLGNRYSLLANYNEPHAISLEVAKDNLARIWIDSTVDRKEGNNTLDKNNAHVGFKNNTYTLTCNGSTIDGEFIPSADATASLYMFNDRIPRTDVFNHSLRMYSCRLYNGGVLERYFIPALRKADQVPGLYDLVNNMFYTDIGAGSFVPGNPVYSKNVVIDIPAEYQSVEYIETTGTQKVTLNIIPKSTYKIESTFTITDLSKNSTIWCSRGSTTTNYSITAFNLTTGLRGDYGTSQNSLGMINNKSKYTLTMDKNSWYINGDLITSGENNAFDGKNKLQLFASYYNGLDQHPGNYAYMKLYSFKVYNEQWQIISYLVPCYRISDTVAGLYDLVSGVFYTNNGTGEFVVGNATYPIPDAYQQIEYIQTTGTQYINTGITTEAIWEYDIQYTKSKLATRQLMGHGGTSGEYWGITDGYYGMSLLKTSDVPAGNRDIYRVENYEGGGNVYINGILAYNNSYDSRTIGKEAQIFAIEGNYANYCKLYSCKVYDKDGTTLLRDYVPAIRNEDDAIGLYDRVTNTFFINNGTGEFVIGEDIPSSKNTELPNEYYKLDYIQSTITGSGYGSQGQQIDTGLTFDMENDWMEITFQSTTANQNGMLFASKQSTNYFWFYHYVEGEVIATYVGQDGEQIQRSAVPIDLQKHQYTWKNKQCILDGVVLATETRALGTTNENIFLFSWNDQYHYEGKIYNCKIWKSGELVRNFVPCYRKADNEVGMFDTVNNVFYTNSGTGSFIPGESNDSLIPGSSILPLNYIETYEQTKYLTSEGEQYIDTGILPTSSIAFEVVFGTDSVINPNGYVLGNGSGDGLEIYLDNGDWVIAFGNETATFDAVPSTKTTIAIANRTVFASINDSQLTPIKLFTNNFESTRTLTLFATNREGGMAMSQGINIYGFRAICGDIMCEYIASIRKEDNEYGFYDNSTQLFKESIGTSKFKSSKDILSKLLPDGYHVLDYIEGTGSQYIDTGIKDSSNTLIEIDALTLTPTSTMGTTTGINISQNMTYPGGYFYYFGHAAAKGKTTTNKRTLFKMNRNICYKDDIYVDSFTAATTTDTQTMFLFGRNMNGTLEDAGDTKIYSCKIYESKILVRYFIPACRDEDGEFGLYELVTGTFCTNQGEGKFLSNETESVYDSVVLPSGYRKVEYVEGTGTQYFDTGLTIEKEDQLIYEGKIKFTTTTKKWTGGNPYLQHTYSYFKTKEEVAYKIVWDGIEEKIYVGDYVIWSQDWTGYNYKHSKLCILALGDKNNTLYSATAIQPARVYYAKLTKNDVVVLDCIPCIRELDGEAGLYDLVTQKFIAKTGLGEVLYGQEINNVPSEYEPVDYIEYTGTQSVEIPYETTSKTKIESNISLNVGSASSFPVYTIGELASLNVNSNGITYRAYGETINGPTINPNTRYALVTTYNPEQALRVNDEVYDVDSLIFGTGGNEIKLFGNSNGLNGTVKIYRIKIFEGSVIQCDLVPCCRKYDGKIGLYDAINNKFYYSESEFECNVTFEAEKVRNLYEELGYVYLDDEHYIDLNYSGNINFIVDAQFNAEDSNGKMGYLSNRDTCWSMGNGKYFFAMGESNYQLGNRDIIIDNYSDTTITRYLNGELVATIPISSKINGLYRIGNAWDDYGYNSDMIVYEIKIEQNGVLIADFCPALRKSDESIGFLDKVTNIFYVVYSNKNNFVMGNLVGHDFAETRVVSEPSEKQDGEVISICSICGEEIHSHTESYAYKVEFTHNVGVKEIKVFKGYDLGQYEIADVAYSRNVNTNNFSRINGQVFFEVVLEEGYKVEKIYAGSGECSQYDGNIYKLSSITSDMMVYVLVQKV